MRIYRVVSLTKAGKIEESDFRDPGDIAKTYEAVGVEEDSYTMRLHGEPVFKGLIGPLSDGKNVVRYETPEAFALLTEKWAKRSKNGSTAE